MEFKVGGIIKSIHNKHTIYEVVGISEDDSSSKPTLSIQVIYTTYTGKCTGYIEKNSLSIFYKLGPVEKLFYNV